MKVGKLLGHPLILILCYLTLIIEGEHFGGFYILYLLALPYGFSYAIVGVAGILLMLFSYLVRNTKLSIFTRHWLYSFALLFMIISLFLFFSRSEKTGVDETFYDTVPLLSFILLCLSVICFVACYLVTGFRSSNNKPG